MIPRQLPQVKVTPESVVLAGGLDLVSPPGLAKAGTCRFAQNYEAELLTGYASVGGIERFDGRPSPSAAQYVVLLVSGAMTGVGLGAQLVGATSGATGTVCYLSPDLSTVGLTALLDGFSFEDGENLKLAGSVVGAVTDSAPNIDAFLDNDIAYAAGEIYRTPIGKPPGNGPVRGVASINNRVYAWRDNGTACHIWRSTSAGWVQVDLGYRVPFSSGSVEYLDGGTLVQGARSATIKRVVTLSGSWSGGTAAGYFVITQPTGGSFVAGAATGSGVCSLTAAESAIQLLAGGRVVAVAHNFYGSTDTKRLYGCDGVNAEFEFDGTVYVPIETGMTTVRATQAFVHKEHLFFAYRGSLQHSGIGDPYKWTPVFGAAELGTGDVITNLINVSGSESNAAMMATCQDSAWVLYGNSSADWNFVRVSEEAGAQSYSGFEITGSMVFDREGFRLFQSTQSFGNFQYESCSQQIDPLVRNARVRASVLVKNKGRYRCFFDDGLVVSVTPMGSGKFAFMPLNYGRIINVAWGAEINGIYRVFYGDDDGWVYEADVGRSFDGDTIDAGLRLSSLNQKSDVVEKQYRRAELKSEAGSAFQLAAGAEYSDSDPNQAGATFNAPIDYLKQYGQGLFWDFGAWDQAYWDGAATNKLSYGVSGVGTCIQLLFNSSSDRQLPHVLKMVTVLYTSRRLTR